MHDDFKITNKIYSDVRYTSYKPKINFVKFTSDNLSLLVPNATNNWSKMHCI